MYTRLLRKPLELHKSFFLFGPRGTGKTTWLKQNLKSSVYLDLLESDLYTKLLSQPSRLGHYIPPSFNDWIIIDEIQKIPGLLNEIHRLIENKSYKFILTGSSARSLRKKGVNLLAGRALTFHMHPLTVRELGTDFNLNSSLQWGHLPAIPSEPDPGLFLKTYVATYLKEEVLQEGLTRNLGDFTRFLETASFSQAQVLNVSEIARETYLDRKRVQGYFSILNDLLLCCQLPVFRKRAKRRMIVHQKFFYFDTGVYRALRPMGPLDLPEEAEGAALETLVFQELAAVNDYFGFEYDLYYWRTAHGAEVDFILYGPKGIIAIEVKRSNRIGSRDLRGLEAFKQDYPEAELYLFYGGMDKEYVDAVKVFPVDFALKNIVSILDMKEL